MAESPERRDKTEETVLLGGFAHETNTFAGGTTGRELFQERRQAFFGDYPDPADAVARTKQLVADSETAVQSAGFNPTRVRLKRFIRGS